MGVVSILMIVVFGVAVGELGVNGSTFWDYYRRAAVGLRGRRRVVSGHNSRALQRLSGVVLGEATEQSGERAAGGVVDAARRHPEYVDRRHT